MDEAGKKEREHFFGAAKVVALLTLASRVFGMFRDMTIVWLGATWQTDAFWFGFMMPNMFRRLFGEGAMTGAFVPVLTQTAEQEGWEKARRLLANTLGLLAVFLIALWAVVQAIFLVWLLLSPERDDRKFLFLLTSLMLPYLFFVCLLALGSAALNCRGHFIYPAAAPIILNLCMIAADGVAAFFWHGSGEAQVKTIAASVSVAGVIQLAGVLWLLKRTGLPAMPRLLPIEPGVKKILVLLGPALLVMGFPQISTSLDIMIAQYFSPNQYAGTTITLFGHVLTRPLAEGVLTRVTAAQRLYMFPLGVLALSLATAVFPLLSRYAVRGDKAGFRDSFNRALRLAFMEGMATGVGLFVLAEPIIGLIYGHHRFAPTDVVKSAAILRMYAVGIWAACTYPILMRSFYSLKDTRTPFRITAITSVVYTSLVLSLIWVPEIREKAFGLVPTITFSVEVVVLGWILRNRLGPIGGRKLALSFLRSAGASAAMAGVVLLLQQWLAGRTNLLVVLSCVCGGAAAFVAAAWIMRVPELGELAGAFRRSK